MATSTSGNVAPDRPVTGPVSLPPDTTTQESAAGAQVANLAQSSILTQEELNALQTTRLNHPEQFANAEAHEPQPPTPALANITPNEIAEQATKLTLFQNSIGASNEMAQQIAQDTMFLTGLAYAGASKEQLELFQNLINESYGNAGVPGTAVGDQRSGNVSGNQTGATAQNLINRFMGGNWIVAIVQAFNQIASMESASSFLEQSAQTSYQKMRYQAALDKKSSLEKEGSLEKERDNKMASYMMAGFAVGVATGALNSLGALGASKLLDMTKSGDVARFEAGSKGLSQTGEGIRGMLAEAAPKYVSAAFAGDIAGQRGQQQVLSEAHDAANATYESARQAVQTRHEAAAKYFEALTHINQSMYQSGHLTRG